MKRQLKFKSGTGIIDAWGRPAIVLSPLTRGLGALSDNDPNTRPDDVVGMYVQYEDGKTASLDVGNYRMENYMEHVTRPTGFGKTPWPAAILIHLFTLAITASLVISGLLPWAPLGLLPAAGLWFGAYQNWAQRWN